MTGPILLTSLQNPQVKIWKSLKIRSDRMESGLFLAEGEHMACEALRSGKITAILCDEAMQDKFSGILENADAIPVYLLAEHVMRAVCDAKSPQGIAAVCRMPGNAPVDGLGDRIVALEGLQDPGNVGTILRTMDAAAFTGLMIDMQTADPFSPKTLRSTMGSIFRIPVRISENMQSELASLRMRGFDILAGDLNGKPFYDRGQDAGRICILIGSEGAGLSPDALSCASKRVRLPMPGKAESLNASVAAGIMIYDVLYRSGVQ